MLAPNTATIVETSRYDPEPFRKQIVEGGGQVFAEGLVEALKPSVPCGLCRRPRYQVWAYRTFAKIAKLTNTEPQVLIAVLQQYGVKDENEMKMLVDQGRRVQMLQNDATASYGDFLEEALSLVELVVKREPQALQGVLARLGKLESAKLESATGEVNGGAG